MIGQDADLIQHSSGGFDLQIDSDGDIQTVDSFWPDLIVSLHSDKRADASEVIRAYLRRGWIGNELNEDGFQIGSKLWLFEQERVTQGTLNALRSEAANCLQWLVTDGYAISVTAEADQNVTLGSVDLTITITVSGGDEFRTTFQMWRNTIGN